MRVLFHIFPIFQILFFVLATLLYKQHLAIALISLLLSALFLNFTLHIVVHHYVHFKFKIKIADRFMELLYTLVIGIPFNLYRMQHFNHHRYNNLIGDFTSTWKEGENGIKAIPFLKYSFLWFIGRPANNNIKQAKQDGDLNDKNQIKIRIELLVLLLFYFLLFTLNPLFPVFYFVLVYLGWSFIASTNYGQHLPVTYGSPTAYSYYSKYYNWLFFNNGLHEEHHLNPQLNYPELKPNKKNKIGLPHLIMGLFRKTN